MATCDAFDMKVWSGFRRLRVSGAHVGRRRSRFARRRGGSRPPDAPPPPGRGVNRHWFGQNGTAPGTAIGTVAMAMVRRQCILHAFWKTGGELAGHSMLGTSLATAAGVRARGQRTKLMSISCGFSETLP